MTVAPATSIPWPTRVRRGFLWFVSLAILGVVFVEILIQTTPFPEATTLPLSGTPVIYDADGGVLATLAENDVRSRVVGKLSDMGRWLPEVTVALEDHRFYDHSGVDLYAIVAAAWPALPVRSLVKAMVSPSGLKRGCMSQAIPEVSLLGFVDPSMGMR